MVSAGIDGLADTGWAAVSVAGFDAAAAFYLDDTTFLVVDVVFFFGGILKFELN